MNTEYDVIVVGGGHNGLIASAYLAKAGKKVLVLEQRHVVGGAAVSEEVFPGFKFSVFSYVVSLLRPKIIRDLELPKHGLKILPLESTLSPLEDGRYLYRNHDHYQTYRSIAQFSRRDADVYEDYGRSMYFMAKAVKYFLDIKPPDPASNKPQDLFSLLKTARYVTGLGEENFNMLAKLMTRSAADFVADWFESEPLRATLACSGIIGSHQGPRSPGSAYVLLHHYMGEIDGAYRAWGFAKGGNGSVTGAIASAARAAGVTIQCNAAVAQLAVRNGTTTGVVLANGDEIKARQVVSSLDPKSTFLRLAGEKNLPEDFVQQIKKFNIRGSSAKVNLALDGLPQLACLPKAGRHLAGAISISPNTDYLERAYDDSKYGEFSRKPFLDIIIPSMIDPDMAPPGKHVMSCFVQYAPYDINGGWSDAKREALGDAVINTLECYIPNIKKILLHRQVLTPADIEEKIGISQGNIFHGELNLSQLFYLRPVAGFAQYNTPIDNFYQCGSGTHPGGGVMGAPGYLAAEEMLR